MRLSQPLPELPAVSAPGPQFHLTEHEEFYGLPRRYVNLHDTPDLNDRLNAMADKVHRPWWLQGMRAFTFGTQPFIRAYAQGEHLLRGGEVEPMTWKRRWALGMAPGFSGYPALIMDLVSQIPGIDPIGKGEARDTMFKHLQTGAEVAGAFGTGLTTMVPQFFQTLTGLDEVAEKLAPGVAAPRMLDFRDVLSVYEPQMFEQAGEGSLPDLIKRYTPLDPFIFSDAPPSYGDLLGFGLDVLADVNNFLPTLKAVGVGGKAVAGLVKSQRAYKSAAQGLHNATRWGHGLLKIGEDGRPVYPWAFGKLTQLIDGVQRTRSRVNEVLGGYFHHGPNLEPLREATDQMDKRLATMKQVANEEFAPESVEVAKRLLDEHVVQEAARRDYTGAYHHIDPDGPTVGSISKLRRGFNSGTDHLPAVRALQDLSRDHIETVFYRTTSEIADEVYDPLRRAFEQYQKTPGWDGVTTSGNVLGEYQYTQRWVARGRNPGSPGRIGGIYLSPAERQSPYEFAMSERLGEKGDQSLWKSTAKKVLDVTDVETFGMEGQNAGIRAFYKLAPDDVEAFERAWQADNGVGPTVMALAQDLVPGINLGKIKYQQGAMDVIGVELARKHGYQAIVNPPWSEMVALDPNAFRQVKDWPGKVDAGPIRRVDSWFQHVKGWIEELEGPADLQVMFNSLMSDSSEFWAARAGEHMDQILGEVAKTKPGLSKAVREFVDWVEPWQQRMAEVGVKEGLLPSWMMESLSRYHTMRVWERWMDPVGFARASEVSDWVLASELNPVGAEMRKRARSGASMGGQTGMTPFAERRDMRTVATIAAEDEGMWDQIIRPGETFGKRTGNAVRIYPHDIDRLGKLSWLESSLRQFELVHSAAARTQFLRHVAKTHGKSLNTVAMEMFRGVNVDWEHLRNVYPRLQKIKETLTPDGATMVTGDLAELAQHVGLRQPGEDATRWFNRLVDDFGVEGAKRIRAQADPLMWRSMLPTADSPYWGPLADQYLPRDLAKALVVGKGSASRLAGELPTTAGLRMMAEGLVKGTRIWKLWHTHLSPPYHGRNFVSNKILTYMQFGFDVRPRHFVGALKSMRNKSGDIYEAMAKHTDLLQSTFGHSEFDDSFAQLARYDTLVGGLPEATWAAYKKGMAAIRKFAAFNEEWDKVAIFNRYYPDLRLAYEAEPHKIPKKWLNRLQPGIEQGTKEFYDATAALAAADLSHKALFHYGRVPPVVNLARGFGLVPFITFPYKALPQVFLNSIEHPQRMGLFSKTFEFLESIDPMREELEAAEPDWMRTGGWITVPIRHGKETYHLDLTYILPWGDIAEHGSLYTAYRNPDQKVVVNPNIPLLNWITEMITGTDLFTGRDIWAAHDPLGTKINKGFAKMAENILPSVMFGSGIGNKVMQKISYHSPRFRERYENAPLIGGILEELWMPGSEQPHTVALAAYAGGMKTRKYDLDRERQLRWWDIDRARQASAKNERDLARRYLTTNMSEDAYYQDLEREREQLERWINNNPYVRWLRSNYVAPSAMVGGE